MYTPDYSAESDPDQIRAIVRDNPFAVLIGPDPHVTHVPLLLDVERGVLVGHMARPNPHGAALHGARVTAVFSGPHGYVSPLWYAKPDGQVPTWSYEAAHVRGTARGLPPEAAVDALHRLVRAMEPADGGWRLDADDPRMKGLVRGIVAFEIAVESIEGKRKLNQNKSEADRQRRVLIGAARERLVDEQMPRHGAHALEHGRILDAFVPEALDETVARARRGHADAVALAAVH